MKVIKSKANLVELFTTDDLIVPCPPGPKFIRNCNHDCDKCWIRWVKHELDIANKEWR